MGSQASVIVLTWNGLHYLKSCLAALRSQDYPAFEILVVDNGSTDGTATWLAEHVPDVRLIRNERNLGFAGGNNAGLRAARGDVLVLLNNDTEVQPGWLAALVRTFDDPAVGLAGCKLLYPDGTIQHAGGFLYGLRAETGHVGRHAPDDGRFDELVDVEFATGAALAIRRTALDEIGLLDEGFSPIYYEDTDWCLRARVAGYRVVYQPEAVVIHYESKATDTFVDFWRRFALNQGRLRLVFKHWSLERLLDEFGPAERAWVAAMDRSDELMAARRAYLDTLLALPQILAFRADSGKIKSPPRKRSAAGGAEGGRIFEEEAAALEALLVDLRAGALNSLEAMQHEPALVSPWQPGPGEPPSPDFAAEPPPEPPSLVPPRTGREEGRLVAALRRLRATLGCLLALPDLLADFDRRLRALEYHGELLGWLSRRADRLNERADWLNSRTDRLADRAAGQGRLVQDLSRDVAENVRELTDLARRLAELERRAGKDG